MTWRTNVIAREALEVQGYATEAGDLEKDALADKIADIFARRALRTSADDALTKTSRFSQQGLSKVQLLDAVLPGFRQQHELSAEEQILLRKDPRSHPDLEERAGAITDVTTLVWGTLGKTPRAGAAQQRLVTMGLLLIEAKLTRDLVSESLKIATDDHDLIIDFYVEPRGDQIVKVSGGVRDDCQMVALAFEGIGDRMRTTLGANVTTAVRQLMQVASPDLTSLTAAFPGAGAGAGIPKAVPARLRA